MTCLINIRPSRFSDYPTIKAFDEFLGDRRLDMQRGEIYVASSDDDRAVGYLRICGSEFMCWPLISILCVDPRSRRNGAARMLLRHVVALEQFPRIFITTEVSNIGMLALLRDISASEIGFVDQFNLSEEREVIFRVK